jgi:hypothetical protein
MHSRKDRKEDIWGMHITNLNKLLQCSSKANWLYRRLMIQLRKLHHLHKLLLTLHRTSSRFRTRVAMVKRKILPSRHQYSLMSRIRCLQCIININILLWGIPMGNLQDGTYLVITLWLKKSQKWNIRSLTKLRWRYSRDCAHDWGTNSVSTSSMGVKLLRD